VDVIIFLVDTSYPIKVSDKKIVETLKDIGKPVILGINKIDMVKKEEVLPVIDAYEGMMDFAGIFPFSARNGKGCDELLTCVYDNLPVGPYFYDPDEYTDQTERQLVCEIIREKSLHALRDEIPHGIAVTVESMKERKKSRRDYSDNASPKERELNSTHVVDIDATIYCEKDSHKGIIIGKGGSMLKKIGTNARYEIEKMLEEPVNLQLHVKVRKDWRDNIGLLKSFGYTENKD
jgi:GTP-binding protein Era